MAVSDAVRKYYAERIFAQSGRDRAPPNFRPLAVAPSGTSTVEGCRGGGKNVLELAMLAEGERVKDVRISCGLCNPAMYACVDVVADWGKGKTFDQVMAVDAFEVKALAPLFQMLGGPGWPDDAREKFQYALLALQNAIRDARGLAVPPAPPVEGPTARDWADDAAD